MGKAAPCRSLAEHIERIICGLEAQRVPMCLQLSGIQHYKSRHFEVLTKKVV